jgi:hypothetical protein
MGVTGKGRKQKSIRQQSRSDLQWSPAFFKDLGGGFQLPVASFQWWGTESLKLSGVPDMAKLYACQQ